MKVKYYIYDNTNIMIMSCKLWLKFTRDIILN